MAYDRGLAQRVRELMEHKRGFAEKKMFGGVCYLLHGNMACGVLNEDLIVRVGPKNHEVALKSAHTRLFDITGKPMRGWVMVSPQGYESEDDLADWVQRGVDFCLSLPPK